MSRAILIVGLVSLTNTATAAPPIDIDTSIVHNTNSDEEVLRGSDDIILANIKLLGNSKKTGVVQQITLTPDAYDEDGERVNLRPVLKRCRIEDVKCPTTRTTGLSSMTTPLPPNCTKPKKYWSRGGIDEFGHVVVDIKDEVTIEYEEIKEYVIRCDMNPGKVRKVGNYRIHMSIDDPDDIKVVDKNDPTRRLVVESKRNNNDGRINTKVVERFYVRLTKDSLPRHRLTPYRVHRPAKFRLVSHKGNLDIGFRLHNCVRQRDEDSSVCAPDQFGIDHVAEGLSVTVNSIDEETGARSLLGTTLLDNHVASSSRFSLSLEDRKAKQLEIVMIAGSVSSTGTQPNSLFQINLEITRIIDPRTGAALNPAEFNSPYIESNTGVIFNAFPEFEPVELNDPRPRAANTGVHRFKIKNQRGNCDVRNFTFRVVARGGSWGSCSGALASSDWSLVDVSNPANEIAISQPGDFVVGCDDDDRIRYVHFDRALAAPPGHIYVQEGDRPRTLELRADTSEADQSLFGSLVVILSDLIWFEPGVSPNADSEHVDLSELQEISVF